MKCIKILAALCLFASLAACTTTNTYTQDPAAKFQNFSASQLYVKGDKALVSRNYNNAVTIYQALESLYPFGEIARKGQLKLIYAYYKQPDYASAEAAAAQYIHVYPRSQNTDYAYYMKGLADFYEGETWVQRTLPINMSQRDLTQAKQAFYDFRDLVQLFPNSQYAPDAIKHMQYLRNMFAQHQLNIAEYYYKRQAYVAAANRASQVIENYQHAPQIKPALVILYKSNRQLDLAKPASNALKVLQMNFPRYAAKADLTSDLIPSQRWW